MRTLKPVRRLFFQFSGLLRSPRLDAYQIFEALEDADLISLRASAQEERSTHYCYTDKAEALKPEQFLPAVRTALKLYVTRKLKLPCALYLPEIRNIKLESKDEWHGFLEVSDLEPWMISTLSLRADSEECIRIEGTLSVVGEPEDSYLSCDEECWLSIDSAGSQAPQVRAPLSSFAAADLEEALAHEFPYSDYWQGQAESAEDDLYDRWKDDQMTDGDSK